MGLLSWIRLYFKCIKLAGLVGFRACARFMIGELQLDDTVIIPDDFPGLSGGDSIG